jgi:hypothetical protein
VGVGLDLDSQVESRDEVAPPQELPAQGGLRPRLDREVEKSENALVSELS